MSKAWPIVKLGEVLSLDLHKVSIDSTRSYDMVGVYSFGRGLFNREPIFNGNTSYKFFYKLSKEHIVMSQLFGWEGALAISSRDFEGKYVSPQFPTFLVDENKLDREFLGWYMRQPKFWEDLGSRTRGMGDRRRTLSPDALFQCYVSLPPLAEQQRIIAKIERLAGKIEEARELRYKTLTEATFFSKSAYRKLIGDSPQENWVYLKNMILDIENGWSPACHKNPAQNGTWGVIKLGAVSFGNFNPMENKELPPTFQPKPQYEIKAGDFLMSRANTTELVGACALVRDTPPKLMLCDKIFRFIFHKDKRIDPAYLDYVIKSPALRTQIEAGATGTSPTMKNIAKAKIMQLRIPAPPLEEQLHTVEYLDNLKVKVAQLKATQAQTTAELDAMLPSILDKAFRGEL